MNIFEGLHSVANIHPVIVHFPIGLLIISTCLFIAGNFKKELFYAAKWNLIIGSLSAIVAVITGLLGAATMPHNDEIHQAMGVHRDIMVITTLLALALAGYIYFQKDLFQIKRFRLFLCGLVFMTAILALGADYGGKMVFKYGAGTELFAKLNPDSGDGHGHKHGNREIKMKKQEGHDHSDHDH